MFLLYCSRRNVCYFCVAVLFHPFAVFEERLVYAVRQVSIGFLFRIFCFQVFVRNSVQQPRSVYAYCRFKSHGIVFRQLVSLIYDVYRIFWNNYFRVLQFISLSVGECVVPFVCMAFPFHRYFTFIQRSLERFYRMCLRHTG